MIGTGQHILVEMWNGDELIHRGVLPPGDNASLFFTDGPQPVSKFSLARITKAEADAIPAEDEASNQERTPE